MRRLLDELAELELAARDERGRWSAPRESGWQRFRALVQDETRREFWWQAWRKRHHFDRGWGMEIFDSATCAAAMRIVIHCGRSAETFNHFAAMVGPSQFGAVAFRQALLDPFDIELLGRLDVTFVCGLADNVLAMAADDAEADIVALLDWLLAQLHATPKKVPAHLHYRLAETLLFREQFEGARELLARIDTPEAQAVLAGIDIAEGRFAEGSARFEAALKALTAETGKRKHLLPPSIAWLYTLALLAQPEPAAWVKARKFAAAESGKREAQPYTFWGLWQSAIDQRLGDSPINAKHFQLARSPNNPRDSLEQLQHLLLAAWLRIELAPRSAQDRLREHGAYLETRLRNAGLLWLARMARRARGAIAERSP